MTKKTRLMQKEAILRRILFDTVQYIILDYRNIFVSRTVRPASVLVIYFSLSLHRELNERKIDKPVS